MSKIIYSFIFTFFLSFNITNQEILRLVDDFPSKNTTNLRFEKNEENENDFNNLKEDSNSISISCYWVNITTFDVWDLSALKRGDKDPDHEIEIIDTDGPNPGPRKLAYNFCGNIKASCRNPTQAATLNKEVCEKELSGDSKNFNLWRMKNPSNNTEGIIIVVNSGEVCQGEEKYNVIWSLTCDDKITEKLKVTNNPVLNKCKLYIEARSPHGNLFI